MSTVARDSLISRGGLLTLALAAAGGLLWLYEGSRERAQLAAEHTPSSLSLSYLRLALEEHPDDPKLRLALVNAALDSGGFADARASLAPLLGQAAPREMRALSIEIERRAYVSTPEEDVDRREAARQRYVSALEKEAPRVVTAPERLSLAQQARSAGAVDLWVKLLQQRVTIDAQLDELSVEQASAALVETGRPLEAARIHERVALAQSAAPALDQALRALTLARSASDADQASAMYARLEPHFNDDAMLEMGLSVADDAGDVEAGFALAERRLAIAPQDPARHRELMTRAAWSGRHTRVLREQVWLATHGGSKADRADAVASARALSDLYTLQMLLGTPRGPMTREGLLERIALHEALGQPDQAHGLLKRALTEAPHRADAGLWSHFAALQLAQGHVLVAVSTLAHMDQRFGVSAARVEQRAHLLLQAGRGPEAVRLLAAHMDAHDYASISRVAQLAFELSQADEAERAYAAAILRPEARQDDFARLYVLHADAGRDTQGLTVALAGLERFDNVAMLELALGAALRAEDEPQIDALLARTRAPGQPLRRDPYYLALRVTRAQGRAEQARAAGEFGEASALLASARSDLTDQGRRVPRASGAGPLTQLLHAQLRAELSLALDTSDRAALVQLYPQVEPLLAARERVVVLHQLERDAEAIALAVQSLELGDLTPEQEAQLAEDASRLAVRLPRLFGVEFELADLGELRTWEARTGVAWAWARQGLTAAVAYTELEPQTSANFSLSRTHELRAQLGGFLLRGRHQAGADLGVDTRNGRSARPYLLMRDAFTLSPDIRFSFSGAVNEVAPDSAELRAKALRDQAGLVSTFHLHVPLSLTLGGRALLWSDRKRQLVGAGFTAEGVLSYHLLPRDSLGRIDLRALARYAPRFNLGDHPELQVPDTTTWLGAGTSLAYGELDVLPVFGRRVSAQLDAALGWLIPQHQLGYYMEASAAVSPFGADALALKVRASNAVGNEPGEWVYGVTLAYSRSLW